MAEIILILLKWEWKYLQHMLVIQQAFIDRCDSMLFSMEPIAFVSCMHTLARLASVS